MLYCGRYELLTVWPRLYLTYCIMQRKWDTFNSEKNRHSFFIKLYKMTRVCICNLMVDLLLKQKKSKHLISKSIWEAWKIRGSYFCKISSLYFPLIVEEKCNNCNDQQPLPAQTRYLLYEYWIPISHCYNIKGKPKNISRSILFDVKILE